MHFLLNFVVEDVLEHLLKYFSLPCMSQNLTVFTGLTGLTRFTGCTRFTSSESLSSTCDCLLGSLVSHISDCIHVPRDSCWGCNANKQDFSARRETGRVWMERPGKSFHFLQMRWIVHATSHNSQGSLERFQDMGLGLLQSLTKNGFNVGPNIYFIHFNLWLVKKVLKELNHRTMTISS